MNLTALIFVTSKREKMKLQSSVTGAIKKLLVVYNQDMKSIIGELCYKLNHHTQLVIWADEETHFQELKNFLDERKISHSENLKSDISKCLIFADNNKFVEWVRDPFLVLSEPGPPAGCVPLRDTRI